MTREDTVTIRVIGGGAAAFSAGQKYSLVMGPGELKDKWNNGDPITRAELEDVLAPHGPFELAEAAPSVADKKSRVSVIRPGAADGQKSQEE